MSDSQMQPLGQHRGKRQWFLTAHLAARHRGVNCIFISPDPTDDMRLLRELDPDLVMIEVVGQLGLIAHPRKRA